MKPPVVLCKNSMDRLNSRPATQYQSLNGIRGRSASRSQLGFGGANLTSAFDLALEWSAVPGGIWGEIEPSCTQQESPSGQTGYHIGEASPKAGYSYIECLPHHCRTGDAHLHSVSISSVVDNAITAVEENKRPSPDADKSSRQKRRKVENLTYLPLEMIAAVVSQVLVSKPICALSLVVPDWRICDRKKSQLGNCLGTTRIVTYIRGVRFQVGSLSYAFDHVENDHILTPGTVFDPDAVLVSVGFSSEYLREFYRSNTHVFNLGMGDFASEAVLDWRNHQPLRSQRLGEILPFDDEDMNIVKRKTVLAPAPIYRYLRHIVVHSPLKLMLVNAESLGIREGGGGQSETEALNNALDLDRSAHLWLSWSQMPKLESLYLDLRIYSHDLNTERRCLSKSQVMGRAQEMGRHLRLKILMLAGLQSYGFHVAYEGVTAQDVEGWDEIGGEPNWIRIFSPAVREEGKIILVDRLIDNY